MGPNSCPPRPAASHRLTRVGSSDASRGSTPLRGLDSMTRMFLPDFRLFIRAREFNSLRNVVGELGRRLIAPQQTASRLSSLPSAYPNRRMRCTNASARPAENTMSRDAREKPRATALPTPVRLRSRECIGQSLNSRTTKNQLKMAFLSTKSCTYA